MDWANERYVRLFVRDTTTWKLLPWQSRALLPLILRKLDRSGVIDVGDDGEEGLAAVVEVPVEFLKEGLPDLLKRDVFRMAGGKFVMPKFLEAQETKQSDAQRKRESRENQRLTAMRSQAVTGCHTLSGSHDVTDCPGQSHDVTPDQTRTIPDPDIAKSSRARDPGTTPPNEPGKPTARYVLDRFASIRAETCPGTAVFWQASPKTADKVATWLADMAPESAVDIEPAIRLACTCVRDGKPGWTDQALADPAFLLGAILSRWSSLRECIHGCAPKVVDRSKHEAQRRSTPVKEW